MVAQRLDCTKQKILAMPRRALLLLTALVLILHWLVLVGLPLAAGRRGAAADGVSHAHAVSAARRATCAPGRPAPAPGTRAGQARETQAPASAGGPTRRHRGQPADSPVQSAPPAPIISPWRPRPPLRPPRRQCRAAIARPRRRCRQPPPKRPNPTRPPQPNPKRLPRQSRPRPPVSRSAPWPAGARASSEPPPVLLPPSTRLSFDVVGEVKNSTTTPAPSCCGASRASATRRAQQIKAFLLGARTQTSVGSITPQGLQPERFGDKSRSERAAHFDFERHEVIFSANTARHHRRGGAGQGSACSCSWVPCWPPRQSATRQARRSR